MFGLAFVFERERERTGSWVDREDLEEFGRTKQHHQNILHKNKTTKIRKAQAQIDS